MIQFTTQRVDRLDDNELILISDWPEKIHKLFTSE